ncbi:MAG TPA: sn-glycerol-1-phosphate dehydrogenase [Casimicrobiaceae bacterium]|nr:sn-glycerol-1-phosphate dehydrogenase [Casimicrobiaceae bacterium]
MTSKPDALAALLRGEWRDPESGAPINLPSLAIAIERSLAGSEADLVEPLRLGRRLAVVSDPATRAVLGGRVERALARVASIEPVILDAEPHADASTVAALRRASVSADALVAVGSGTINDLCKYAAAQDGKPYAVFATAPSMNGYTSKNAAITVDGHKKTLPAALTRGVFMDLEILAAAPARMIRAGLGDSMCRSTAQADWLLSHHLFATPYREAPFALLADDEPALLDDPEALLRKDLDAMRALARTLILSGLGMTICDGSYPASQGEHLISHYIDMQSPSYRASYFHGEQVGVATLTMARIQETVLVGGPPQLQRDAISESELQRRFGADVGASCWHEFDRKRLTGDRLASVQRHIDTRWDEIRSSVRRAMIPVARIHQVLGRANCAETASDIGVDDAFYAKAVRDARFLRDRYTFLDLAADSQHRDLVNTKLAA